MKPWVKQMLADEGKTFQSLEEEQEFLREERLASLDRLAEAVKQRASDADRARYEQRVVDGLTCDIARQQNKAGEGLRP